MPTGHDRRRFLQLAGTGAAASLAGCAELGLQSNDDDDRITAVVDAPNEDLEELQERVEQGEIDQLEAQEEVQELRSNAIEEFEAYVDDEDVTIEESSDETEGLYLIDGSDEAILGALRSGPLTVLYGGEAYDLILEQQQQQPDPEDLPDEPPEEDSPEDEDDDGDEDGDTDDDDTDDGDTDSE